MNYADGETLRILSSLKLVTIIVSNILYHI